MRVFTDLDRLLKILAFRSSQIERGMNTRRARARLVTAMAGAKHTVNLATVFSEEVEKSLSFLFLEILRCSEFITDV
jgi:hypothetical protein